MKAIIAKGTMNTIPVEMARRAKPFFCVFFKAGLIHLRKIFSTSMLNQPKTSPTSIP